MRNMKLNLSLALVVLVVLFALQNSEELQVRFLFWSITMRRVFVLFGVLAIGIVCGWFMRAHTETKIRENIERQGKQ